MDSLMGYFTQEIAAGSLIAGRGKQTVFHLKTDTILKFKRVFKDEYHICLKVRVGADFITLAQAGYGLDDTLSEGSGGVLNAGSQAECIL